MYIYIYIYIYIYYLFIYICNLYAHIFFGLFMRICTIYYLYNLSLLIFTDDKTTNAVSVIEAKYSSSIGYLALSFTISTACLFIMLDLKNIIFS